MASVQIKNVPDEVRDELHRRADQAGKSLQQYLLERLIQEASAPSLDDVLHRAAGLPGAELSVEHYVQLVRGDREAQ